MANIALDIKANTQKALGEFRKLSKELDNKFLVQGLKLDVVKNAFRQINREFEQSLGQQGFNTAESTNQLQRNAAANLAALNKLSIDAAANLTKGVTRNLQELQAQGEITGEAIRETLTAASFFDFRGSQQEVEAAFNSFSERFAKFATATNDIFGKSRAGQLQRVLTGQARVEELFNLDLGAGGAGSNLIAKYLRDQGLGVENLSAETRSQIIDRFLRDVKDTNTEIGKTFALLERQAQIDDPFRFLKREISSLFSPRGVFGVLTAYGTTIREINGEQVPVDRNILNTTAKLLKAFFDKDSGLFATLFGALGEAFGFDPKKPLEPIIRGIELFTKVIESLTDFFGGPTFQSILNVFTPFVEAVRNIFSGGKLDFSVESINKVITNIFEGIRGFLSKVTDSIKNIDANAATTIFSNVATEIAKSIPPLIGFLVESIKKGFELGISAIGGAEGIGGKAVAALGVGAIASAVTAPLVNFFTRRQGGFAGILGRRADARVRNSLFRARRKDGRGNRRSIADFFTGLFQRGGGKVNYASGDPDLARGGGFSGWQGEVIRKFNQIIIIMRDSVPVHMKRPGFFGGAGRDGIPITERDRLGNPTSTPRGRYGREDQYRNRLDDPLGYRISRATRGARERIEDIGIGARTRIRNLPRDIRQLPGRSVRGIRNFGVGAGARYGLPLMDFMSGQRYITNESIEDVLNRNSEYTMRESDFQNLTRDEQRDYLGRMRGREALRNDPALRRRFNRRFRRRRTRISDSISGIGRRAGRFGRGIAGIGATAMSFMAGDAYGMDEFEGSQYLAPIGPLPMDSVEPWMYNEETGNFDPRMVSREDPNMRRMRVQQRYDRRMAYRRSPMGRIRGFGRGLGRVGRGLGRLGGPVVGAALTAFSLASLFGGGDANAAEMEGMTPEDKRQMRRDRNRQVLGGLAGIAGGAAGGALLGSALGPVGTVLGGVLGGIVGEEAVKNLSDPIIDGIGDLADGVGNWFKGLWGNIVGGFGALGRGVQEGWDNIVGFFGEDGPIQKTGRWFYDLPGKIRDTLEGAWNTITGVISDAPSWLLASLLGPLGIAAGPLISLLKGDYSGSKDQLDKRSLGGRVMFNEKGSGEIGILPGGTTFITPTSMPQVLSAMSGRSQTGDVNNSIVVNVYSDGGTTEEVADAVIARIDEVYKSLSNSQGLTVI